MAVGCSDCSDQRAVAKILQGAKPGELPFEQAVKYTLVINMKTARQLGITPSPTLLATADELIE